MKTISTKKEIQSFFDAFERKIDNSFSSIQSASTANVKGASQETNFRKLIAELNDMKSAVKTAVSQIKNSSKIIMATQTTQDRELERKVESIQYFIGGYGTTFSTPLSTSERQDWLTRNPHLTGTGIRYTTLLTVCLTK